MKRLLNDRRILYYMLSIMIILVFTLTIAYAALNTVLKITGNAEVVASSWDIYLDNVQLVSGSATTNVPTITDKTTASFYTTLKNPGDYYMFTVDVVNNGSIDAMIDSVEKLPELSSSQAKYLNYIVEYQNGESISTKQLVEANSFVRLKVKIMLRTDILSEDLPQTAETLNLSFKVNYVQADENNTSSIQNSGKLVQVVNGDYNTVGSEICIGEECIYVISSTEDDVTMLAKYNLYVGNKCTASSTCTELENSTGIQEQSIKGWFNGYGSDNPMLGTKPFSNISYWNDITTYPSEVYNENSYLYEYVENYKNYLSGLGIINVGARLISLDELVSLGCDSANLNCLSAPSWIYLTTYWCSTADSLDCVWGVDSNGAFKFNGYFDNGRGVRPVITISKSEF